METIYFVRHGQTDWNVAGKMQGREDIPLNENGIEQAKLLAAFFDKKEIDAVYASPLKRAKKTADIIVEKKSVDVLVDERLIERDFGLLSGMPFASLHEKTESDDELGIESFESISKRVDEVLDAIENKGEQSLVVTHGVTLLKLLEAQGFGFSLDKQTQGVVYCVQIIDAKKVCYAHDLVNDTVSTLKEIR